jgi:hypothetical protein
MLILDPEFRALLLEHHRSLNQRREENKILSLTPAILDEYENLVGHSYTLTRARFGEFSQPEQEFQPIRRLDDIEEDLMALKNKVDSIIRNYMPNFYEIHSAWIARRQAVELGNANRAFRKPWQPSRSQKGGLSGFVRGIIVVLFLGFLIMPLLTGDKLRVNIVDSLVPPDTEQGYWLNDAEKQLLQEWQQAAKAGQSRYLAGLAHRNYHSLKQAGAKLVGQADLWLKADSLDQAAIRFAWASEIGTVLKRVYEDDDLLVEVAKLRTTTQRPPEETTLK